MHMWNKQIKRYDNKGPFQAHRIVCLEGAFYLDEHVDVIHNNFVDQ